MLREALQRRMVDLRDMRVLLQSGGQFGGIGHLLGHTQSYCMDAAHDHPGGKGVSGSAAVHTDRGDLVNQFGGGRNRAAQCVAVSIDEFGHTVDDDVRAEVQRANSQRGGEGVVYNQHSTIFVSQFRASRNICQIHAGISSDLTVDDGGVRLDSGFHVGHVVKADGCGFHSKFGQEFLHNIQRFTIAARTINNVVARLQKGQQSAGDSTHAGRTDQ